MSKAGSAVSTDEQPGGAGGRLAVTFVTVLFSRKYCARVTCCHVDIPLLLLHSTHVPPQMADLSEDNSVPRGHNCPPVKGPLSKMSGADNKSDAPSQNGEIPMRGGTAGVTLLDPGEGGTGSES